MIKRFSGRGFFAFLAAVVMFVAFTIIDGPVGQSASLTSASVTLSNPRLSFNGLLAAGNSVGSSIVTIKTTGAPSESTAQLQAGDSVTIGATVFNVAETTPPSVFSIDGGLVTSTEDTVVTAAQLSNLTARFTTANAISGGTFRVLVPAASANANDGVPDAGAWDYGTPTVTCPTTITGYSFAAGSAAPSAVTIGSQDYHSFTCQYSGTGGVGTTFGVGGSPNSTPIVINGLVNPAPDTGHTVGNADSHVLIIQHLDAGNNVIDDVSVAVGVIEAVKVTATVAPVINFSIGNVASGQTRCGVTTDVSTTPYSVPFGVIGLQAFTNAAQSLTVSTNAANGYAVTAIANDQLGLNAKTCTGDPTPASDPECIQDTTGNGANISHTAPGQWDDVTYKGFGYSLQEDTAGKAVFNYNDTTGNCTGGTYCARQFADAEAAEDPVSVMTSNTVAEADIIDVCYRVVPSAINAAGNYENTITYTATATF